MDALRGAAMLLGVVLHAAIAYMPCRMPHLVWAVHDRASSTLLDWLFWWIHGFRLPLFFLIAGFFAVMLYESRGAHGFLMNRTRRLLLPLLLVGVVVLPLTFVIFSCGWLVSGQCHPSQVLRMKFPQAIQNELWGLAHLWFLEHLFLMCLGYWGWRRLAARRFRFAAPRAALAAWQQHLLASPWKPLWLALPTATIVWLDPNVVLSFHHAIVPDPLWLMYYGAFFLAGAALYRQRHMLDVAAPQNVSRFSTGYLLLSIPVLISLGLLLRLHLTGSLTALQQLTLALAVSLFAWLMTFGSLGTFLRWTNRSRPWIRYLADASYWIYLVHLPIVGLVQVLLYDLTWPAGLKFTISTCAATAIGLVTYRDLVRQTAIGRLLNGAPTHDGSWNYERLIPYGAILAGLLTLAGYGLWHGRALLFDGNLHAVIDGEVYRGGQPSAASVARLIERFELQSVINLQGGSQQIPKFVQEKQACEQRGVQFLVIDLPDGCLPRDAELIELIELIDRAPRPILLHGQYGIARTGLAAAVVELLAGHNIERARQQLGLQYGHLDRTPGAGQHLLRAYELWLSRNRRRHTADGFRDWARYGYRQSIVTMCALHDDWSLCEPREMP